MLLKRWLFCYWNFKEPVNEIKEKYGWTNSWSDIHDYWDCIDEGYLTLEQFINYNKCKDWFRDKLDDDEIYSMANSNEFEI